MILKSVVLPGDREGSMALSKATYFLWLEAKRAAADPTGWNAFVDAFHDNCAILGVNGVFMEIDRHNWHFDLEIADRSRLFNLLMDDLFMAVAA